MLNISNITKVYRKGSEAFTALNNVSFIINDGDYVAVTGASGAGKSTLLYSIGGLVRPDSGEVLYNGNDIWKQNRRATNEYRKKHLGFMFQQFHLMPYLTVLENIKLACHGKSQLKNIDKYLESCLLLSLKKKYPDELSVGEKQRVAFIRAIISSPDILLADEPTGNLDPDNSMILMSLLGDYNKSGKTVVLVSHDPLATKYANRTVLLDKGKLAAS